MSAYCGHFFVTKRIILRVRCSIFKVHLKPIKTDLDIEAVARKMAALTPGFTGMKGGM